MSGRTYARLRVRGEQADRAALEAIEAELRVSEAQLERIRERELRTTLLLSSDRRQSGGWPEFICRRCGNLAYQTENATRSGRKLLKAKRLHVRLGGTGNLFEELPEKPPEMSWRTYERLRERGEAARQAVFEAIEERLRLSSARLGRIQEAIEDITNRER